MLTLPPLSASPPAPWKGSAFPSASHPLLFFPSRGCASAGDNMRRAGIGQTRSGAGNRNHERMGGTASSKDISAENALERPSLSTEQRAEPFPRQINTTQEMLHAKCRNSRCRASPTLHRQARFSFPPVSIRPITNLSRQVLPSGKRVADFHFQMSPAHESFPTDHSCNLLNQQHISIFLFPSCFGRETALISLREVL